MPIFTFESEMHPIFGEEAGDCFPVTLLLPDICSDMVDIVAYAGGFQKSIISKSLASEFGFDISMGTCIGEIVIQTKFEGDVVYRRSQPFPVTFSKSRPDMGDAYVHLSIAQLEGSFSHQIYVPKHLDEQSPFLVLRRDKSPEEFCIEVPIERPGAL